MIHRHAENVKVAMAWHNMDQRMQNTTVTMETDMCGICYSCCVVQCWNGRRNQQKWNQTRQWQSRRKGKPTLL